MDDTDKACPKSRRTDLEPGTAYQCHVATQHEARYHVGMARLVGVRSKDGTGNREEVSSVQFERRLAELFRTVQRIGGYRTPSELLEAMLVSFCRHELPTVEMEFSDEDTVRQRRASADAKQQRLDDLAEAGKRLDQSGTPERRQAERRKKKGTAALWAEEGNLDRRTKGSDRRKP